MRTFSQPELEAIELDYRAGIKSVNAIAKLHKVPEPTLRRLAKKYAWVRGAADIKRQVVADHFAGVTKGVTNDEVRHNQQEAANEDIADMERGLRVHRACLIQLEAAVTGESGATAPKDIKIITEAAALAIAGIRKIRGLDAPISAEAKDIDAAIEAELAKLDGDRQAGTAANA